MSFWSGYPMSNVARTPADFAPSWPRSPASRPPCGEVAIIGFGTYHFRYPTGHEGDSALASFSPRSQPLAIYLIAEFENWHESVLVRLGRHQTGKSCIYIKRLDRVDEDVLRELIDRSVRVPKPSTARNTTSGSDWP
jgi:hypothetical protein